ncbi:MAG: 3-methyl-2-oxobutanoate hydroxymethyltransferase [Microbacteriaceae bacterium]
MSNFSPKVVRTSTLRAFKEAGEKFAVLTSYDSLTAGIFDDSGIDVILVGDSAADNALGYSTTLPITLDEMISFGRAVAGSVKRSLVVVDLPFGSYEQSPAHALESALKVMKFTGAGAVKLEGGVRSAAAIKAITDAGIPVMAHIGFTPQSVHGLGGFKVQGRGEDAQKLIDDAKAVEEAGAFAVVLELVPAELAAEVTRLQSIPTIGIGAGNATDGQVLVWTDFAGMHGGTKRKFVRQYANLRETLAAAASAYRQDVRSGDFPNEAEEF